MEGRQRVKQYKSLSWQPALVLCCFTEVSLWWEIFQWQKTLAAEVIHCCCRNLVLARESQWVRQFWEQQWPASVPCHALLMWECCCRTAGVDCAGKCIRSGQIWIIYLLLQWIAFLRQDKQSPMLSTMEKSTRTIWIISVKLEPSEHMFYFLPHWFFDAFNLYMSILWLNAWLFMRQYSKPVAPVPFHVANQTCHLVNNILCCKKSVSSVQFKMFIMVCQSTLRSRAPKLSHRPESCAKYFL